MAHLEPVSLSWLELPRIRIIRRWNTMTGKRLGKTHRQACGLQVYILTGPRRRARRSQQAIQMKNMNELYREYRNRTAFVESIPFSLYFIYTYNSVIPHNRGRLLPSQHAPTQHVAFFIKILFNPSRRQEKIQITLAVHQGHGNRVGNAITYIPH